MHALNINIHWRKYQLKTFIQISLRSKQMMAWTWMSRLALSVCSFFCFYLVYKQKNKQTRLTDRFRSMCLWVFSTTRNCWLVEKRESGSFTTLGLFVAQTVFCGFIAQFLRFSSHDSVTRNCQLVEFLCFSGAQSVLATLTVEVFACLQSKKETNKQKEAPTCCDFDFD